MFLHCREGRKKELKLFEEVRGETTRGKFTGFRNKEEISKRNRRDEKRC